MANSFTDQAAGPKNLQRPFGSSMLGRRTRSGTFKHGFPQDHPDIEGAIDTCKIKWSPSAPGVQPRGEGTNTRSGCEPAHKSHSQALTSLPTQIKPSVPLTM
jgi:hypothetical protein